MRINLDPRKWPLTVKLISVVTTLLIVTTIALSIQTIRRETASFEEELSQQAHVLLDVVSVPITDPLYFLDFDAISDILENLGEDNEIIVFGQVYDLNGRIVSDAFTENITLNTSPDPFGQQVVALEEEELELKPEMMLAARPIKVGNQTLGGLAIGLSTAPLAEKIMVVRNQGLVIGLSAGILGVFVAIVLTRLIARPLNQLVDATEEIAQGNIWKEITVQGQDEIGLLASAMENMRKELYSLYSGLEAEVMERSVALEASEVRFKEVVSSIGDYIYVAEFSPTTGWKWQFISQKIDRLLGYPFELIYRTDQLWNRFVDPKDATIAQEQESGFRLGKSSEAEFRFIKSDQSSLWVRNSGRVVKNIESGSVMVYGVLSDISERKAAERELAAARDKALESSQVKTQFIANVSHELRTPLNAILGYAEILKAGIIGQINAEQDDKLKQILSSTNQMANLINNLLDQAQLEVHNIDLNERSFTPQDLIDEVDAVVSGFAAEKGLSLSYFIDRNMPTSIKADFNRLTQILINLINNAIKFTERGEIKISILPLNNKTWALEVRDPGIGIPKEAQMTIFEPFQQVDKSKADRRKGVGLGLSIVKQLAEAMGGEISVNSMPGAGSTFTIVLPLKEAEGINVI